MFEKIKVIITSGGTREKIDPVRYLGNYSSGKMGAALSAELTKAGFGVIVISAPAAVEYSGKVIWVESAEQMLVAVLQNLPADIFIGAAAVADKKPKNYSATKIKKENLHTIELAENPDILQTIATQNSRPKLVVGFAAESENHIKNARGKLTKKSCDLIVANDINALGSDKNEVWLVGNNFAEKIPQAPKPKIAAEIVKKIREIYGTN